MNKNIKKILFFFVFAVFIQAAEEQWEIVWQDEFDGTTLDMSKWSYWKNGHPFDIKYYSNADGDLVDSGGNKQKFYYLDENIKVENGDLVLTAKKEENKYVNVENGTAKIDYSGSALSTDKKYSVKYGKIEMRAKMPKGVGTFPAFWMWPAEYPKKIGERAEGEIDIAEAYGDSFNQVFGTLHILKKDNTYKSIFHSNKKIKNPSELTDNYNIYSVEWNEKEIKWLYNNKVFKKVTMNKVKRITDRLEDNPFNKPYFIILDVALQEKTGNDPATLKDFPTEMKIDYVRVYQKINPLKYFD